MTRALRPHERTTVQTLRATRPLDTCAQISVLASIALGRNISARSVRRVVRGRAVAGSPPPPSRVNWSKPPPDDDVVDAAVWLDAQEYGWNFGSRFVLPRLRERYPNLRFSRAAVLASSRKLNPSAFIVRTEQALRQMIKSGSFFAPCFRYLWQSDMNMVLADYGVYHNSIVDVCSSFWVSLVPMTCYLAHVVCEVSFRPAAEEAGGLPYVLTTDKGVEPNVYVYTQRRAAYLAPYPPADPPHKYLKSKRNSVVESYQGRVNTQCNIYAKVMFVYMEQVLRIYDRNDPIQKGALANVAVIVLRHADEQLRRSHNIHPVRGANGRSKGIPEQLRASKPYNGPPRVLPGGVDLTAEYESATGRRMRREPRWARQRDPLYGQPHRQAARMSAVLAALGDLKSAWADVMHNTGRARFIPAYQLYLSFR